MTYSVLSDGERFRGKRSALNGDDDDRGERQGGIEVNGGDGNK